MLVVSRRTDESIVIGDDIVITITEITGSAVRVGIEAPPEISVHREEVYQRLLDAENEAGPVLSTTS